MLSFPVEQHPIVCQVGGNNPLAMGQAARIVQEYGYDEINVNCGCLTASIKKSAYGVIGMKDPSLVAQIVTEMRRQVNLPISVKCRIGANDLEKWSEIERFFTIVSEEGGIKKFIIHCRKNTHSRGKDLPEPKYPWVFNLKK